MLHSTWGGGGVHISALDVEFGGHDPEQMSHQIITPGVHLEQYIEFIDR